ncbi:hypothetical protein [Chryseobacterium pennae]|nr:hypothetical protein [Chryseobacterium pennae]
MKQLFTLFIFVLGGFVFEQTYSSTDSSPSQLPVHQLRIYEIPKENR